MALDNANFIAELSITDPPGSDPLSQGDDQIRTAKRTQLQTLPLLDKAVNISSDQMNLMAIKNEVNVFTEVNIFRKNVALQPLNATSDIEYAWLDSLGITLWALRKIQQTTTNDLELIRNDAAGAPVDKPWVCDFTTGIVDFAQPPTINGDPIWTAGELKMLVVGSTPPSNNWFVADGLNGTVDLRARFLAMEGGGFTGTQGAFLSAKTDAALSTGSTAITAAQMPVHNHTARGGSASGITDVQVGFSSAETVFGANRGNTGGVYVDTNNTGFRYIDNAGSGAGHTHTLPEQNVEADNTGNAAVVPFAYYAIFVQYVP